MSCGHPLSRWMRRPISASWRTCEVESGSGALGGRPSRIGIRTPDVRPLIRSSARPRQVSMTISSSRPLTGSTVNRTPATSALTMRCRTTAVRISDRSIWRGAVRTHRLAPGGGADLANGPDELIPRPHVQDRHELSGEGRAVRVLGRGRGPHSDAPSQRLEHAAFRHLLRSGREHERLGDGYPLARQVRQVEGLRPGPFGRIHIEQGDESIQMR